MTSAQAIEIIRSSDVNDESDRVTEALLSLSPGQMAGLVVIGLV